MFFRHNHSKKHALVNKFTESGHFSIGHGSSELFEMVSPFRGQKKTVESEADLKWSRSVLTSAIAMERVLMQLSAASLVLSAWIDFSGREFLGSMAIVFLMSNLIFSIIAIKRLWDISLDSGSKRQSVRLSFFPQWFTFQLLLTSASFLSLGLIHLI